MRRLLVALLVVPAAAVGVDLGAARLTESALAEQAGRAGVVGARADVPGFPFLTQAVRERYERVALTGSGTFGGVEVTRLDVEVRGARVPLSEALSGTVTAVPVDGLRGAVLVSYPSLSRQAGRRLALSAAGDRLRVQGSVEVLGQTVRAAALSRVGLDDRGRLVVRAEAFETGSGLADDVLRRVVGDRFDVRVEVGALPYGLALTGVQVTPAGVRLSAAAGPSVLEGEAVAPAGG